MLGVTAVLAAPAAAETASSIGPLEFFEGSTTTAAIVAPSLDSLSQTITNATGPSTGSAGGGAGKVKVSDLHITKPIDSASPKLVMATAKGTHFSRVAVQVSAGDSALSYCLSDAFITSDSVSVSASAGGSIEAIDVAFLKYTLGYGSGGCSSAGSGPDVVTSLVGLGKGAASIVARVDCLQPHCSGKLVAGLPGGATTGGAKFSMGDGSVRLLHLAVPPASRGDLRSLGDGSVKTLLTLKGHGAPIVSHASFAPPKGIPGLTPVSLAPPSTAPSSPAPGPTPTPTPAPTPTPTPEPTPTPTPTPLAQSVAITGCREVVAGVPGAAVAVTGSLTPARAAVRVSLEFVATGGPQPFPAPIVLSTTTDAAGNFSQNFARQQGGSDYSWTVVATVAEGGGYLAATSPSCAIPIP